MNVALLDRLEEVFGWLLTASWQASVLALLVLGLQWALGARLNPRWRYALWLLVLVRLLLPFQVESALSLFQFAPAPPTGLSVPMTQPLFSTAPTMTAPASAPVLLIAGEASEPSFSLYSIVALVWLAGVLILGVLTFEVNRRFARQVAASPEVIDPAILALFAETKGELNMRRAVRLVESAQVRSPAIMGLFRPALLLPARVRETFDLADLRLIFLHELAHLKRGDVIAQVVIALLQTLHWFNPLLWFAFRRMRADREPAADALVLSRAGEAEKERYGLMLVKMLEHFQQRHALPTLVGILEEKDAFKRRFQLIARFTRGAYGWSVIGIVLLLVLGVSCLTRAKTAQDQSAIYAHFNAVVDGDNIRGLKVWEMPLPDFVAKISAMLKESDPEKTGVPIKLILPPGEQPLTISFGYPPSDYDLGNLLYHLEALYPLRYEIGDESVTITQLSHAEIELNRKAKETKVDLHLDQTDVATALKLLQTSAAAKGFAFDLDLDAIKSMGPRPVTLDVKQWSVEQALGSICYLADVLPSKLDKSNGYRIAPGTEKELHKLVWLHVGASVIPFDPTDAKGIAQTLESIQKGQAHNTWAIGGPSISGPVFPWTYRGKVGEPGGQMVTSALSLKDVKLSFTYKPVVIDKTHVQFAVAIELKDAKGNSLGTMSGQWTQPSGMIASLLKDGEPLTIELPDVKHTRKTLVVLVQSRLEDEEQQNLIPPAKQVMEVSLSPNRTSVPAYLPPVVPDDSSYSRMEEASKTPLMKALQVNDYAAARTLLQQGVDPAAQDKAGNTALGTFVNYEPQTGPFPLDIVETILKRTGNPNPILYAESATPSYSDPVFEIAIIAVPIAKPAVAADARKVAQLLMAHGARFTGVTDGKVEALLEAAVSGDLKTIQQIIRDGTPIDSADAHGWNALNIVVAFGYDDCADWLIAHGANVVAKSRRGYTSPLEFAVERGQTDLAEKLIAHGAKPDLEDGGLWRAVDQNNQRLFDDLIKAGANPNEDGEMFGGDGHGKMRRQISWDALYTCIEKGQTAMAVTLLDKGYDPEPPGVQQNQSYAYWAVHYDRPEILQALLNHGANPLLKDAQGETPLSIAQKSHPDLVPMLQAAIAKGHEATSAGPALDMLKAAAKRTPEKAH